METELTSTDILNIEKKMHRKAGWAGFLLVVSLFAVIAFFILTLIKPLINAPLPRGISAYDRFIAPLTLKDGDWLHFGVLAITPLFLILAIIDFIKSIGDHKKHGSSSVRKYANAFMMVIIPTGLYFVVTNCDWAALPFWAKIYPAAVLALTLIGSIISLTVHTVNLASGRREIEKKNKKEGR